MSRAKRIKQLELRRAELVSSIVGTEEMLLGSFQSIYTKCGKPNCWCAGKEVGHLSNRITWYQETRLKNRTVPQKDMLWVKSMTENRRRFRKQRQQLRVLDKEIKKEIDGLEKEVVTKTREKKAWMN